MSAGVTKVIGVDTNGSVSGKRSKYVFFQWIGPGASRTRKAHAGPFKAPLLHYFHGHTVALEIFDRDDLSQPEMERRLRACGGAFQPSSYEFSSGKTVKEFTFESPPDASMITLSDKPRVLKGATNAVEEATTGASSPASTKPEVEATSTLAASEAATAGAGEAEVAGASNKDTSTATTDKLPESECPDVKGTAVTVKDVAGKVTMPEDTGNLKANKAAGGSGVVAAGAATVSASKASAVGTEKSTSLAVASKGGVSGKSTSTSAAESRGVSPVAGAVDLVEPSPAARASPPSASESVVSDVKTADAEVAAPRVGSEVIKKQPETKQSETRNTSKERKEVDTASVTSAKHSHEDKEQPNESKPVLPESTTVADKQTTERGRAAHADSTSSTEQVAPAAETKDITATATAPTSESHHEADDANKVPEEAATGTSDTAQTEKKPESAGVDGGTATTSSTTQAEGTSSTGNGDKDIVDKKEAAAAEAHPEEEKVSSTADAAVGDSVPGVTRSDTVIIHEDVETPRAEAEPQASTAPPAATEHSVHASVSEQTLQTSPHEEPKAGHTDSSVIQKLGHVADEHVVGLVGEDGAATGTASADGHPSDATGRKLSQGGAEYEHNHDVVAE